MSEAGRISKVKNISRKKARVLKKDWDKTAKVTNKNLREYGAKIKFVWPKKGGRRRYVTHE